jgi:glycosyltransferase involved in cell wall biosynthesis
MKNLYINLIPIQIGGGLQNAINFLLNLDINQVKHKNIIMLIRNNSTLIDICKEKDFKYQIINNTFISRLNYELFFFLNKKNSMIFTLFGTKPILSWGAKTITGCAYSNLFYPKIDFWGYLSPIKKLIKKLKDTYRYWNVKSSDVVIFETDLLRKKAVEEFSFKKEHTHTVKMAVSSIVKKDETFINFNIQKENFNILYLGSAHPNKRQHLLPSIVKNMLDEGIKDFSFILTMDEQNSYAKKVLTLVSEMNLERYIINIGSVPSYQVANLISQSNAMINIARLESFSNNFVEAWQMEKILFVTGDEWAKESCNDAAIYLDVNNLSSVSLKIQRIINNKNLYDDIIQKGINQLDSYPTPKEKISQFVQIMNKYYKEEKK